MTGLKSRRGVHGRLCLGQGPDRPDPGRPAWLTAAFGALFLGGWVLTRGANMQKYRFKTAPGRRFLWLTPEALTDGKNSLLANGYFPAPYVALMLTRKADDDKVCRAKYGQLWDRYTAKVKWRIVPHVY